MASCTARKTLRSILRRSAPNAIRPSWVNASMHWRKLFTPSVSCADTAGSRLARASFTWKTANHTVQKTMLLCSQLNAPGASLPSRRVISSSTSWRQNIMSIVSFARNATCHCSRMEDSQPRIASRIVANMLVN